jgi:hypothetical protein
MVPGDDMRVTQLQADLTLRWNTLVSSLEELEIAVVATSRALDAEAPSAVATFVTAASSSRGMPGTQVARGSSGHWADQASDADWRSVAGDTQATHEAGTVFDMPSASMRDDASSIGFSHISASQPAHGLGRDALAQHTLAMQGPPMRRLSELQIFDPLATQDTLATVKLGSALPNDPVARVGTLDAIAEVKAPAPREEVPAKPRPAPSPQGPAAPRHAVASSPPAPAAMQCQTRDFRLLEQPLATPMAAGGKGVGKKAFDTFGWRDNSWWQQRPAANASSSQQWHAGGGKSTWTSRGKPGDGTANVTHAKQQPRPYGTTSTTSLPTDGEPHWFYYPSPAGWRIVMQDLPGDATPTWAPYIRTV